MVKELNIKLGEKNTFSEPPKEVYYPTLNFYEKEGVDLPKEGIMEIRYKKTGSSESTDSEGKTRYSCTIEVREIKSVESEEDEASEEAPSKNHDEAGAALDKLMVEKMKALKAKKKESY